MKRIVLLVVSVVAPFCLFAGSIKLSDAITKHIIDMDAVTTAGKYTGRSVRLKLTNTGNATLDVKVDVGVILKNSDPNYTQLVLAGGESVTVKAHQAEEIDVQVFSANGFKTCPVAGLHYTYARNCGEMTTKVLEYIRQQGLFDQLGQAGVWAMTNYLPLSCVFDRARFSESEKLINFIATNTKREKPRYYTTYSDYEVAGQRAFVGKADVVFVPFDVSMSMPGHVTFEVHDAAGSFVKNAGQPQMVNAGKHSILAELTATDYQTGKYTVRAKAYSSGVLAERTVYIEQPWITIKD